MTTNEEAVSLTREIVKAAKPKAARYMIWDAYLKGFGLRVEPSGTQTYIVRYRVGGGRRGTLRQLKIGSAKVFTPTEARKLAETALAAVSTGKDPQADRVLMRETPTVARMIDDYLAGATSTKKASTNELDLIRLEGFVKRRLGSKKANEVTRQDIDRLRDDIAEGKLAGPPLTPEERKQAADHRDDPKKHPPLPPGRRVVGGKTAATKTVKLVRAIYRWAINSKTYPQVTENPCDGVKTFADNKREEFLSPAQMGDLGDALTAAEAEGANPAHIAVIRLLALSGARKNEIARLRRSEVRDDGAWLQLDDSKTGRKAVKLGAAAKEVLVAALKAAPDNSEYVFPDPRDPSLPVRNLDWAWVGIRKRAGLDSFRLHDLRHSFASVGVGGGAGLFLIGKLLGHAHAATTSRYSHLRDDPLTAVADRIAGEVAAAMTRAPAADIQKLGEGRS